MPRHHAHSRTNRRRVLGPPALPPAAGGSGAAHDAGFALCRLQQRWLGRPRRRRPDTNVGAAQNAGAVRVIYGSRNGLTTPSVAFTQDNLGVDTSQTGDHFGIALAAGDFNNDSWDDLAIGADKDSGTATTPAQSM